MKSKVDVTPCKLCGRPEGWWGCYCDERLQLRATRIALGAPFAGIAAAGLR